MCVTGSRCPRRAAPAHTGWMGYGSEWAAEMAGPGGEKQREGDSRRPALVVAWIRAPTKRRVRSVRMAARIRGPPGSGRVVGAAGTAGAAIAVLAGAVGVVASLGLHVHIVTHAYDDSVRPRSRAVDWRSIVGPCHGRLSRDAACRGPCNGHRESVVDDGFRLPAFFHATEAPVGEGADPGGHEQPDDHESEVVQVDPADPVRDRFRPAQVVV